VSPPTGANRSPERTSTFVTSFIHTLTRASVTARSLMSVAMMRSQSGESRMATAPAPQPTSSALRARFEGELARTSWRVASPGPMTASAPEETLSLRMRFPPATLSM
jgi:hypothetical protein